MLANSQSAGRAVEGCIVLERKDADTMGNMRRKHIPWPDSVFCRWGIRRGLPCAEVVAAQSGDEDDAVFMECNC